MKKILSLALASAMVLSMFSACGSSPKESSSSKSESSKSESSASSESESSASEESSEAEAKDPVVVSIIMAEGATAPYSEDWVIFDYIDQYSGGTFDVECVPVADYYTKKSLLMNTGDIPDVITRSFETTAEAYSGMLLPINVMEENMTVYPQWIDDCNIRDVVDNTLYYGNGNYYTMPSSTFGYNVKSQGWGIRSDIFEANGLEAPKTMDDLYDVGVKLKEIYPDSSPLSNAMGAKVIFTGFAGAFGTMAGYTIENCAQYLYDEDEWVFAPTTQNWKDMLTYTNKLYEAGVLDQEFATQQTEGYEAKISQGKAMILFEYFGNYTRYTLAGQAENPDFELTPIEPLSGVGEYADNYALQWGVPWDMGWSFSSKIQEREDYQEVLDFMDWFYTDEACQILSFGTEEYYDVIDGIMMEKDVNDNNGIADGHLIGRKHPDLAYAGWGDQAHVIKEIYDFNTEHDAIPPVMPKTQFTLEQLESYQVTITNCVDYANQMMETFTYGTEKVDDFWDEYLATFESKGAVDYINEYNAAWDARTK